MSIENTVILENLSAAAENATTDKFVGAGYYRKAAGFQTFQFILDEFKGRIRVQGTLELYPGEESWVDLEFLNGSVIDSVDSSTFSGSLIRNIQGNWLWIRLKYTLEEGIITQVRYNL
jgi:hypothetical protein